MADHLLDHVRPYLDRSVEDRIAYIRAPRWIGHHVAKQAHEGLSELLSRPPALQTIGLMLVGPYANGKTMIAERFAVEHFRTVERQKSVGGADAGGRRPCPFLWKHSTGTAGATGNSRDVGRKAEQINHLFDSLKPKILIFDEFHNALRGRSRDVEAVLAFLRRIGRQFDISPVLIGEVAVFDFVNATSEMASRFDLLAVALWRRVSHAPRQPRRRLAAPAVPIFSMRSLRERSSSIPRD
ncbi:TniB family NTP-binding protein [Allomesorhizobium camelthorni]|uniref:TniB family NTP-binding protein n=1 Tax=Allomesorhizobium camelthorni TaxID=475069 RepID=UPI001FE3BD0D|nr:TniB family NTP-binding protein [Mesorhizobium camelthorni]